MVAVAGPDEEPLEEINGDDTRGVYDLALPYADTLEEELPLGTELDIDSIAEYEATQVGEAVRFITLSAPGWFSATAARNTAIAELARIDLHYHMDADEPHQASRVATPGQTEPYHIRITHKNDVHSQDGDRN